MSSSVYPFPLSMPNLLAQGYLDDPETEAVSPPGYRDKAYDHAYTVSMSTVPSTAANANQRLALEGDADFIFREFRFNAHSAAFTYTPAIRLRFPDGSYWSTDFVRLADIVGQHYPQIWWPRGGVLLADYLLLDPSGAGTATVQLVFRGRKRFKL